MTGHPFNAISGVFPVPEHRGRIFMLLAGALTSRCLDRSREQEEGPIQATRASLGKLFGLLCPLSLVVVQICFTNSQAFRSHFKQLVVIDKLDALLEAHLFSLADFYGV